MSRPAANISAAFIASCAFRTGPPSKVYKKTRGKPAAGDLVFLDPDGRAHTPFGLADVLRAHLETIGLKRERPELFKSSDARLRIRVHDLRGTFVTVALANGKSEAWVSDRTGHRSSAMIHKYKRTARSFEELQLGTLTPLVSAIPELAAGKLSSGSGTAPGTESTKQQKKRASPRGFEPGQTLTFFEVLAMFSNDQGRRSSGILSLSPRPFRPDRLIDRLLPRPRTRLAQHSPMPLSARQALANGRL